MRCGRRNPRRIYDKEGREQPPGRVDTLPPGYVVEAHFAACQHRARIDLSRWPANFPLPDIALHLKCSACGTEGDLISIQLCQAENPFAG